MEVYSLPYMGSKASIAIPLIEKMIELKPQSNYKTKQDFKKSYDKKLKELKDYCRFQKLNYEKIKEKI